MQDARCSNNIEEPATPSAGPRSHDFRNVPVHETGYLRVQGCVIPWTITNPDYNDTERCYLVSPFAHYILYAYDEIRLHAAKKGFHRLQQFMASFIVFCFGLIARLLGLDECLYFNNWLLSTNLWPSSRVGSYFDS